MKLVVSLKGSLAYEPVVGDRMIIFVDGKEKYYTSPITAMHRRSNDGIEFETRNTIYKITYEKENKSRKIA